MLPERPRLTAEGGYRCLVICAPRRRRLTLAAACSWPPPTPKLRPAGRLRRQPQRQRQPVHRPRAASRRRRPTSRADFSTGPVFTELLGFNAGPLYRRRAGHRQRQLRLRRRAHRRFGLPARHAPQLGPTRRRRSLRPQRPGQRPGRRQQHLPGCQRVRRPAARSRRSTSASLRPAGRVSATVDITWSARSPTRAPGPSWSPTCPLSLTPAVPRHGRRALGRLRGTTFNSPCHRPDGRRRGAPDSNIISWTCSRSATPGRRSGRVRHLTNVDRQSCFTRPLGVCADPGVFLHGRRAPDGAGHRMIAGLANDYLYYGDIGAQCALQGETAYRHREDVWTGGASLFGPRGLGRRAPALWSAAWRQDRHRRPRHGGRGERRRLWRAAGLDPAPREPALRLRAPWPSGRCRGGHA